MEWTEPELIQEKPRKDKKGRRNKHKGKKENTKATTTTTSKTKTTTATLTITQQAHAESTTKLPPSFTTELPVSRSSISSTSTTFLLTDNVSETTQSSEKISSFKNVTIDSYLATWEATAPSSSIELLTGAETTSSVESSSGRARTKNMSCRQSLIDSKTKRMF